MSMACAQASCMSTNDHFFPTPIHDSKIAPSHAVCDHCQEVQLYKNTGLEHLMCHILDLCSGVVIM